MLKLNTLKDTDGIIGQIYINGKVTNEVMAVQYGAAIGLNCNRHWKDVTCAGHEFYINPIAIELCDVVQETTANIFLPARCK